MSATTGEISKADSAVIWHPYTPMKVLPNAVGIVRGEGSWLIAEDGGRFLDVQSSWWVNLHGHANKYIAQKVAHQMGQLEHCIFAGFTHEPAVQLAQRLLNILPANMGKVFYSDNGSTAVEVALKMALQYWRNKGERRTRIIALENAYHGDTFGAMSVSGRGPFTEAFSSLLFEVTFIPFPGEGNEAQCVAALRAALAGGDVAAFIVEPLVQGSAGMQMYNAGVLNELWTVCREAGALIIDDEVMTGFGRTGTLFACDQVDVCPDIVCLSKGITGGFFPFGATVTTAEVFSAFYDDDRSKMLYHGHSYTANATICAAALASLDLLLLPECLDARKNIATKHQEFSTKIGNWGSVRALRQAGTILAIEVNTGGEGYHHTIRDKMYAYFLNSEVLMRPLGNIIYLIPPYCITDEELNLAYSAIKRFLASVDLL